MPKPVFILADDGNSAEKDYSKSDDAKGAGGLEIGITEPAPQKYCYRHGDDIQYGAD